MALPAARSYANIASDAPHALHMPSHIFTRLGLWEDSIRSNLASAAAAQRYIAKVAPGASSFDDLHAEDYLVYAYLQLGRDAEARGVVERVSRVELPGSRTPKGRTRKRSDWRVRRRTSRTRPTSIRSLRAPIVPARELLGDLLLELHQSAPALKEYEASLVVAPNRFHGLAGATRAARAARAAGVSIN